MPLPPPERPVVRYDAETHARVLHRELDELLLALQQPAWREATGEAWLTRVHREIDAVRARLRQPFVLLVVGDFKRGKSTLVNALLGRELVTMDVAPETVVLTEVTYGPEVRVEARLTDGGRVALRAEDLPSGRLSPILENLPGAVDVLRIEAPVEWLRDVAVVDSPGTGDLLWRFDQRVQEYLPRADAVLHVVSAVSPLSDSERSFLRIALRPLDLAKVVFVVNQLDLIRAQRDAERVTARVAESIAPLFPDSPVLGVSALHELARRTGEEPPRPELARELDVAFDELRALLERRVLLHREVVRNERAVHDADQGLARVADELRRLQGRVESDRGSLRDALARVRDQGSAARAGVSAREARIREAIAGLAEQAVRWMDGLVTRIETEAVPQLAEIGHEDAQRHFPFFLAETLRDGLGASVGAHQELVLALVEQASDEAARDLETELSPGGATRAVERAAERAGFHTPAWTVFDHVHTAALVLNMLTAGLASVFAGLLDRAGATKERAENFRSGVARSIPALRAEVEKATRSAYRDLTDAVCARLRAAQEDELTRIEAELSQALTLHDHGLERLREAGVSLAEVLARIEATRATLADLRLRLREAADG